MSTLDLSEEVPTAEASETADEPNITTTVEDVPEENPENEEEDTATAVAAEPEVTEPEVEETAEEAVNEEEEVEEEEVAVAAEPEVEETAAEPEVDGTAAAVAAEPEEEEEEDENDELSNLLKSYGLEKYLENLKDNGYNTIESIKGFTRRDYSRINIDYRYFRVLQSIIDNY